jgi:predicted homoserine dehydrogenase-like protein
MIIVDTALAKREDEGNPIRVGIIGAGYMGRALTLQIISAVPGMDVVGVYNRTISRAELAFTQSEINDARYASSIQDVEKAAKLGKCVYTDDPMILCEADNIDCIVEATGEVEFGADVALRAIEYGKHVVLLNAEVDAVLGPLLKYKADQAGVCITNCDGDQPGVVMNLYRWVKSIGYNPVLAGNIKGLLDHYRNPTTQEKFAREAKQQTKMITSFADGTKLAMEMAVVANATGFKVGVRGMHGPACDHAKDALDLFPKDQLLNGGLADYILGAEPGPGVFVIGYNDHPIKKQVAQTLKMGDGPFYCFYVPYHLPHLETPLSVARAVLFHDPTIAPLGAPVAEVITTAKIDLTAGTKLDGIGGYHAYGLLENIDISNKEQLLPMSLSHDCVLKRDIKMDEAISYEDVILPTDRKCDRLRNEQNKIYAKN